MYTTKFRIFYVIVFILLLNPLIQGQQDEDLPLSGAIEYALKNNYGIIISRGNSQIAGISNSWGNAGRYPSIGFDVSNRNSYDITDPNITNNFVTAGLGLQWNLFNGFRVWITKEQLAQLENLAHGQSAVVIESTIDDIIMGYYLVLLQDKKLEVFEKVKTLSEDRYKYELARKELGGSLTYNVLLAKNVYLSDKANYLTQEVVYRNAFRNLNYLMGFESERFWNFTDPFEADSMEYVFGDLLEKMKSDNRTLKNQYINLLLKQSELNIKKSSLYPSLSLSAGIEDNWSRIANPAGNSSTGNGVSAYGNLNLSYDIFAGGTKRRAVKIASINEELAQTEINQIIHNLTNQLYNEFDYYNVRRELLDVERESLQAAELNLQIAEEKYKSGVINSFNYRDIQLIYIQSALSELEAIYNLIGSHTALTRLTGGFITQ
ncbi:MAG: TolC family protein [Bacteroidales bacterium]|nr:TolC family protein [Bacteroidales bacterium]